MTDTTPAHEIVWKLDGGSLRASVVCHLDQDADCHRMPACECEVWSRPVRDDRGVIVGHLATTYDDDNDTEVEVTHPNIPSAECGHVLWLMEEPELLPELTDDSDIEIGRTAIKPSWDGDGVTWSVA